MSVYVALPDVTAARTQAEALAAPASPARIRQRVVLWSSADSPTPEGSAIRLCNAT